MATTAAATTKATGYLDPNSLYFEAQNREQRYVEQRVKRLREDGNNQFLDVSLDHSFGPFIRDPWVDPEKVKVASTMFPENRCDVLILGAGWGGLLYAIRMVQAGISPKDIRMVDIAGGFGGTWYWNRYPGVSCDIESYCYLPLLEETGYIPQQRYSTGEEIRRYAELAAQEWGLTESTVFQTKAEKLCWDEGSKEWLVDLVQEREGEDRLELKVRARCVSTVNGPLHWPKVPRIPGLLDYQGDVFHSSRWDYAVTGGSSSDPSLIHLKGKRVAIIGTGATAVQIIPYVARWAKHLFVVQRTPASVDHRIQRETDQEWFYKNIATAPGWQRDRIRNFHQHFTTENQPTVNMVGDSWTGAVAMCAVCGNSAGPKTMDELPEYMKKLHSLDIPRQERIHRWVEGEVTDPIVAKQLQAWYPTWCKRPVFHEEYLSTFNRDNVTLIDTDGKGVDRITVDSIVAGGQSCPVDVVVFATGFRAPFIGSPAEKANMTIVGRDGISMSEEWARNGPSTQHGVLDHNFPNLFLSGPWQASLSPSNLFNTDALAKHSAYILTEMKRKCGDNPFAIAPSAGAAEDWATQILMRSAPMAALGGCTPSYFNVEGMLDRTPPEMQMKMAKSGLWGHGIEDFVRVIEAWREEGSMRGLEIHV